VQITGKEDHEELVRFTNYFNRPMTIKRVSCLSSQAAVLEAQAVRLRKRKCSVPTCIGFLDVAGVCPVVALEYDDFELSLR
jgi:hypothetical protein